MGQHNQTSKLNHDILLLKAVKSLKEKSDLGEEKMKEKDVEIEELRVLNAKKDLELKEMKNEMNKLKTQFEQLETDLKRNVEKMNDRFEPLKEQTQHSAKVEQLEKDFGDLQKFAEKISELQYNLGDELYTRTRNNHMYTVFQKGYDKDDGTNKWNRLVKEVNEKKSQHKYFTSLKNSINEYKKTIYSPSYEERLYTFTVRLPFGREWGNNDVGYFIRIQCYPWTKKICVSYGHNLRDLKKKIDEYDDSRSKVQNFHNVCYFYDDENCLHVVKGGSRDWNYYLLHKSNEDEKLKLTNGRKIMIDDISKYMITGSSIVLWAK